MSAQSLKDIPILGNLSHTNLNLIYEKIHLASDYVWDFDYKAVFCIVIAVSTLIYVLSIIQALYFSSLSKYPGPRSWACSRLPLSYHFLKGDVWHAVLKLHDQYGTVVRIAPNELSTISPEAWKDIYTTKPILPKDPLSQTPPLKGAHSLFTAVGQEHQRLRGVFANSFSERTLREQTPIIDHYVTLLIDRIRRETTHNTDHVVDIHKLIGYASFDIISDLTSGQPENGLEGMNEHTLIQRFYMHSIFSTVRSVLIHFPPLDKLLVALFLGLSARKREENWNRGFERLDNRLRQQDRLDKRRDLLTAVIEKVDDQKGKGISKVELWTNCLGFVIASCQLTTLSLSATLYLLLTNGTAMARLVEEIRHHFEKEEDITYQSTQELRYLDAVLNEALRMHHPTPITLPRVLPPEGRMIDDYYVPGNNIIGINLQVIQNSPANWTDARHFCPERFLPADDPRYDVRFAKDNKLAFAPYSTGPRNCIGAKLYLAQARAILARMIWKFDLELANKNDDGRRLERHRAWLAFEHEPLLINATTPRAR